MSEGGKRKLEEVLSKAVSDLAKATVDTANQVPIDTLEELRLIKKSVDVLSSKTDALITKGQETILVNTTQHAALLQQLTTLTSAVTKSSKVPTLQWAINNANFGTFNYYEETNRVSSGNTSKSEVIVRQILLTFMQGCGCFVEGFVFTTINNRYQQITAAEVAAARTAFHTALINHIHSLTGVKPRIAPAASDTNKFAIYYQ